MTEKNPGFLLTNIRRFLRLEAASGIVLMIAAVLAMIVANSGLASSYASILELKVGPLSVSHWINDGLMAIFFFVVGMEIKHELQDGALSTRERASLPVFGALGGMIVPAMVYVYIAGSNPEFHSGWGIPMATDIAFAVGVVSLLGKRVDPALKIFLLALAIADDLGAVLVIAIFYTSGVKILALVAAVVLIAAIYFLSKYKIRNVFLHLPLGIAVWFLVHESGIHATIAGCALGFLMPHEDSNPNDPTPLERWVHRLHPISGFVIMPIFALANAGVSMGGVDLKEAFASPLVIAIGAGLFLGKPLGIFGMCYAACKLKIAGLPEGVRWSQIFAIGCLAGIGFTMALFIANLAIKNHLWIDYAKIGIVTGSLLSAIVGSAMFLALSREPRSKA